MNWESDPSSPQKADSTTTTHVVIVGQCYCCERPIYGYESILLAECCGQLFHDPCGTTLFGLTEKCLSCEERFSLVVFSLTFPRDFIMHVRSATDDEAEMEHELIQKICTLKVELAKKEFLTYEPQLAAHNLNSEDIDCLDQLASKSSLYNKIRHADIDAMTFFFPSKPRSHDIRSLYRHTAANIKAYFTYLESIKDGIDYTSSLRRIASMTSKRSDFKDLKDIIKGRKRR